MGWKDWTHWRKGLLIFWCLWAIVSVGFYVRGSLYAIQLQLDNFDSGYTGDPKWEAEYAEAQDITKMGWTLLKAPLAYPAVQVPVVVAFWSLIGAGVGLAWGRVSERTRA